MIIRLWTMSKSPEFTGGAASFIEPVSAPNDPITGKISIFAKKRAGSCLEVPENMGFLAEIRLASRPYNREISGGYQGTPATYQGILERKRPAQKRSNARPKR
jgi:hypothetical protein